MELINLIKAYLNRASMTRYAFEANYLDPSSSVFVSFDNGTACYTKQNPGYYRSSTNYSVVLGFNFYPSLRGVNPKYEIPLDSQSLIYSDISMLYDAVFYHELGHVLFTPMKLAYEVHEYIRKQNGNHFSSLYGTVSNIIEDVVIEAEIKYLRPLTSNSINHLRKVAFSKVPETVTPDLQGALDVMLYNFRTISASRSVYPDEAINKMILTYMYVCINTQDPTKRLYRTLAFTAALWDVFNLKQKPHYKNYDAGLDASFYTKLPVEYKDKDDDDKIDPSSATPNTSSIIKTGGGMSEDTAPSSTQSSTPTSGENVDQPAKDVEATVVKRNEGFSDSADDSHQKPINIDEREVLQLAHTNVVCDSRRHRFDTITGRYDSSPLLTRYNEVTSKYGVMINQIADLIKKRKAWNNTHWEADRTTGKLNDKAFIKKTHKIYKQRSLPKVEADLVFSILVDNSGSMGGFKTRICGEALIVLAEVCEKLRIPFEVNAFTENREAITIGLKSFEDTFSKVKTNLSLIQQEVSVPGLSMFSGNIDEINLEFVWQNFRTRKEKDKILIVISDGETCGSTDRLKELVKQIHKDKITVLGLGIKTKEVDKIYPYHKTFNTDADLQELPKFLNEYLISKVFKNVEGGN